MSTKEEQVNVLVENRRRDGSLDSILIVAEPGASAITFKCRHSDGCWAIAGPLFFIRALQDILIWGDHDSIISLEEFFHGNQWFPAEFGISAVAALRNLSSRLEAMDDIQFSQLLHALFDLRDMDETTEFKLEGDRLNRVKNMEMFLSSVYRKH